MLSSTSTSILCYTFHHHGVKHHLSFICLSNFPPHHPTARDTTRWTYKKTLVTSFILLSLLFINFTSIIFFCSVFFMNGKKHLLWYFLCYLHYLKFLLQHHLFITFCIIIGKKKKKLLPSSLCPGNFLHYHLVFLIIHNIISPSFVLHYHHSCYLQYSQYLLQDPSFITFYIIIGKNFSTIYVQAVFFFIISEQEIHNAGDIKGRL